MYGGAYTIWRRRCKPGATHRGGRVADERCSPGLTHYGGGRVAPLLVTATFATLRALPTDGGRVAGKCPGGVVRRRRLSAGGVGASRPRPIRPFRGRHSPLWRYQVPPSGPRWSGLVPPIPYSTPALRHPARPAPLAHPVPTAPAPCHRPALHAVVCRSPLPLPPRSSGRRPGSPRGWGGVPARERGGGS